MKIKKKLGISLITILLAASPIIAGSQPQIVTASRTAKNKLMVIGDAYIYHKNGRIYRYYNQIKGVNNNTDSDGYCYLDAEDGDTISYTGRTATIKGHKYYQLTKNTYIKKENVYSVNGKNIRQGKLDLNHKSQIYTKSGHKTDQVLAKHSFVKYAGKVKKSATMPKYFYYSKNNKYLYLPTHKIKGQDYYSLGNNRYVNAKNVDSINGQTARYNGVTYATVNKNAYTQTISNGQTSHRLTKGQKIKVDMAVIPWSEDFDGYIYHLHDYPNEYIDASYINLRNDLPITDYSDMAYTQAKPQVDQPLTFYTVTGEAETKQPIIRKDNSFKVDGKFYLWVPSEHKAELFYHVLELDNNDDNAPVVKDPTYSNSFVKASDVKITSGQKLSTLNDAATAEADSVTATSQDKQELQQLFAAGQTDLDKFRTGADLYRNYENALTIAASTLRSSTVSRGEVKEAVWLIKTTKQQANGLYFEPWS